MVPNQPTDKNAKFPNRGVALIHHPFGIVASGVSHHPSPPQPASESAACELPVSCLGKSAIWMFNLGCPNCNWWNKSDGRVFTNANSSSTSQALPFLLELQWWTLSVDFGGSKFGIRGNLRQMSFGADRHPQDLWGFPRTTCQTTTNQPPTTNQSYPLVI